MIDLTQDLMAFDLNELTNLTSPIETMNMGMDNFNDNGLDLNPLLDVALPQNLVDDHLGLQNEPFSTVLVQENSVMEAPSTMTHETIDGFREHHLYSAATPVTITNTPLPVEVIKRKPQVNIYDSAEPEDKSMELENQAAENCSENHASENSCSE